MACYLVPLALLEHTDHLLIDFTGTAVTLTLPLLFYLVPVFLLGELLLRKGAYVIDLSLWGLNYHLPPVCAQSLATLIMSVKVVHSSPPPQVSGSCL